MKETDFLAIGDTVIDAFIKLTDADRPDIRGIPDHEDYKICLPYAEKIPYEEVYIINAVGNAANAAVSASRLGLESALVTNLGDDQNGKDCLKSLTQDGVNTDFVKINIGSATKLKPSELMKMEIRGRDGFSGLPKTVEVNSDEVTEAISDVIQKIIGAAKGVLEQIPPELASDIIDKGIVMSGGTSMLKNLDKHITDSLGVPAALAENPLLCVALGTGMALENLDLYKRSVSKR